jgi:hypothetical protein
LAGLPPYFSVWKRFNLRLVLDGAVFILKIDRLPPTPLGWGRAFVHKAFCKSANMGRFLC